TSFAPMAGYQTALKLPWSNSVFTDCARLANSASSSAVVVGNGSSGAIELPAPVIGEIGTDPPVTLAPVCGDGAGVPPPPGIVTVSPLGGVPGGCAATAAGGAAAGSFE